MGFVFVISKASLAIELPSQSCFSISADGQPELSLFVMEDLQNAGQKTLQIKFGYLEKNVSLQAEPETTGTTLPISEATIKAGTASYRGIGFLLDIDQANKDPAHNKIVFGKFNLESSVQIIDPATKKAASFKNKTLSCAKMR